MSPAAVRQAAWLCLTGALLIGFGLVFILKSPILLFLVAGGVFIAWGYTAPPLSLAYRGWGELVLFIAFGPLLVLGGYYLQSVNFSGAAAVLSLAPGFLIAALLMANEIADAGDDARAGKKNLAVRWGPSRAGVLIAVGIGGAYAVVVLGGLSGLFPATFLLILFTIFWAERALRSLRTAVRAGGGFRLSSARMIVFYNIFIIAMIIIILIS